MLTEDQKTWISRVLGIDAGGAAVAAKGQAQGQGKQFVGAGPADASGGAPAPGQARQGNKTVTLSTTAGKFVYFASVEGMMRPILEDLGSKYDKVQGLERDMMVKTMRLEHLEETYASFEVQDIAQEVAAHTDRTAHEAAGAARGAENTYKGFFKFVQKIARDLPKAKKEIELAENDIKVNELGKEIEHLKQLKEGVDKVLDIATDIIKIATDWKDPGAWIDLGKDLVKDAVDAGFDAKIEPLAKQAEKITDSNLKDRLALARQTLADALGDLQDWKTFLDETAHDLEVKVDERNDAYDEHAKKSRAGVVRMSDLKEGGELGRELYRLLNDGVGTASSLSSLLRELQAGKTERWMGDPAVCNATIGQMLSYARSIDKEYIHRIVGVVSSVSASSGFMPQPGRRWRTSACRRNRRPGGHVRRRVGRTPAPPPAG
jgi:hypothetical protein